jgi:APA family basic amino acid/polyamine antiporter
MAIMVQAIWAGALLATGRYGALLDYVVFCDWIFFGLAVISLFAIRRHDRETGVSAPPDAFQVPGWPFAPLLFVAAAIYVVMGSISSNPRNALLGLGILLLGVPVFHYWRRRSRVEGRESRLESQATIDS